MKKGGSKLNSKNLESNSLKKYSKISLKKRMTLIDEIQKNGKNIYQASKFLKIKYSTAKAIILRYKKAGNVLVYKKSPIKRMKSQWKVQKFERKQQESQKQIKKEQKSSESIIQELTQQSQILKPSSEFLIYCWFGHFMQWMFCNSYN